MTIGLYCLAVGVLLIAAGCLTALLSRVNGDDE
jgi:hypothetical protein